MSQKILIVDDEADVVELVSFNLKNAGFSVVSAGDGNTALLMAKEHVPSLIILDIMMPVMDGTEVCKYLKKDPLTSSIPVVMLTAKGETVDKILGLELGADDYITKPFSPRELILRVKSILKRRSTEKIEDTLTVGEITLDRARHEVFIKGKPIVLTATEFKLLSLLIERKGRVQSRERLLQDVWDYSSAVDTRTVDTHVRRLRKKLAKNAKLIETTRGVGYRVLDPV